MLHRLASLCSQPFLRTVETVIHNKIGQIGAIGTGMTTIMHSRQVVQAADRARGAVMRDPLAELCDDLSGFEAEDITALLCDLPIPIPGDVPGMTVEEAIYIIVYTIIYTMIYFMVNMVYTMIYMYIYALLIYAVILGARSHDL